MDLMKSGVSFRNRYGFIYQIIAQVKLAEIRKLLDSAKVLNHVLAEV